MFMQNPKLTLLLSFFIIAVLSCVSSRNAEPSRIGIVPLHQFKANEASLNADTLYKVTRNAEEFDASFTSLVGTNTRPDFHAQMAVAMLLKNATTAGLQFEKAEVEGSTVNIYLRSCAGTATENCLKGNALIATIPKVGSAKKVRFFVNNSTRFIAGL